MKKATVLFLALLAIVVVISGCVGNQTQNATPPSPPLGSPAQTPPASTGVSGEIPTADQGSGITVETPNSTSGENVDLGGNLI